MTIPFAKAHGAGNDFLLSWSDDVFELDLAEAAQAICHRHTGIGADGWLVVTPKRDADSPYHGVIRLFNPDGTEPELSGNGTRCAAAFLIEAGYATQEVSILTGAGPKQLRVLQRQGSKFLFEMNMGEPKYSQEQLSLQLPLSAGLREVAVLDVGNPQCAVFVNNFDLDWRAMGAEIEGHTHFPNRTNVSFVRPVDEHSIDVRFYERGVGETQSSGTGSTGAAAAAILRGVAKSPVRVLTVADPLDLRWEGSIYLSGPAEIFARGEFYLA
jgi:diaminopimelate epimerase